MTIETIETASLLRPAPRVGFLGVGWIGRNRMEAILSTRTIVPAGIAEPDAAMASAAGALAPEAACVDSLDALLALDLDGLVIATPSGLHAQQCLRALEAGVAVFCQKPLGRTAAEVEAVVGAARRNDLLLGVDFSYRHTEAMRRIRELAASDALGPVHAVDLTFHNAYGPDKPWFYDVSQSGGGCLMDLGIHLVDLALWTLGGSEVLRVSSHLFAGGTAVKTPADAVEDHAIATIETVEGTVIRLACSWRMHAGCDAVIGAEFYGSKGGAAMRNVDGSFYDFTADHFTGTGRTRLAGPPDAWGGRAAAAWARRLADDAGYDEEADSLVEVARLVDRLYRRG